LPWTPDHFKSCKVIDMIDARRHKALVLVVTALAPLSALGCGSSDDNSPSEPLPKAQILKMGDQICKQRLAEKDRAVKATLKTFSSSEIAKPSKANLETIGKSILPPIQRMADEFAGLNPKAKQDRAELKELTSKLQAGLKTAEAHLDQLVQTDPFEKAGDVARGYGFKTCSF
jgi:hypothetical protein